MDKHHNRSNNGGGGFLLGLIIGAALTLLLVTKKGRSILKILADEGMDKLGEWEGIIKDVKDSLGEDDEDVIEGSDYVVENERHATAKTPNEPHETLKEEDRVESRHEEPVSHSTEEAPVEQSTVSRIKTTTRRFFRGVPKRG